MTKDLDAELPKILLFNQSSSPDYRIVGFSCERSGTRTRTNKHSLRVDGCLDEMEVQLATDIENK